MQPAFAWRSLTSGETKKNGRRDGLRRRIPTPTRSFDPPKDILRATFIFDCIQLYTRG